MNSRLQEFDILRVMAAFAVIAIHITAGYATLTLLAYTVNQLVRFAVPIFVIISGFLLFYTDNMHGFNSALIFYRKRFRHILWPYFIWTITYFIVGLVISGGYDGLWNAMIQIGRHLLWGTACYHLYFLVIIFQLYLLYPIIRSSIKKWPHITLIIALGLTFTTQTLLYLDMMNLLPLSHKYQSLYLVAFPVWIFYFVLGMYVVLYQKKIQAIISKKIWLIAFAWVLSIAMLLIDSHLTGTYATSMRPSVIFYTICTFFLCYALGSGYKKKLGSWVSWLSNQSFLIFLMHPLLLTALIYGSKYTLPFLWNGIWGMVALYMATAILTVGSVWLISFSRLAPYLGGTISTKKGAAVKCSTFLSL